MQVLIYLIKFEDGGTKGQLISKCLFGVFTSPKKQTKKFDFTAMVPQVELFLFVFLGELKTQKKTFQN
jgi:hypothetical protein